MEQFQARAGLEIGRGENEMIKRKQIYLGMI